jgi:hypothetical protein
LYIKTILNNKKQKWAKRKSANGIRLSSCLRPCFLWRDGPPHPAPGSSQGLLAGRSKQRYFRSPNRTQEAGRRAVQELGSAPLVVCTRARVRETQARPCIAPLLHAFPSFPYHLRSSATSSSSSPLTASSGNAPNRRNRWNLPRNRPNSIFVTDGQQC